MPIGPGFAKDLNGATVSGCFSASDSCGYEQCFHTFSHTMVMVI
jgi:hypothetical protein